MVLTDVLKQGTSNHRSLNIAETCAMSVSVIVLILM